MRIGSAGGVPPGVRRGSYSAASSVTDIGAQADLRAEMASVTAASAGREAPVTIGVDDPVEDVTG